MTKEEINFDNHTTHQTKIEAKNVKNPYAKKYMENKKTLVVLEDIVRLIDHVKNKRGFKSTNDTLKYLTKVESDVSKLNMIKEFAKCPDCGKLMPIEHVKKIHNHADSKVECFGCMQKSYQVVLNENDHQKTAKTLIEQKEKQGEQTGANDLEFDEYGTPKGNVTKTWNTPKGQIFTVDGIDYLGGKKVISYSDNDDNKPITEGEKTERQAN